MGYQLIGLEQRIRENVKNYSMDSLFLKKYMEEQFRTISDIMQASVYVTDARGNLFLQIDQAAGLQGEIRSEEEQDICREEQGIRLEVCGNAVGIVYYDKSVIPQEKQELYARLMQETCMLLMAFAEESYLHKESTLYIEDLKAHMNEERNQILSGAKEDPLTGVFNKTYFTHRMDIVDRSEVIPVAVINVNINDWRYANDHFGEEESDRLIAVIAQILKEQAKPEYIIGRTDGDVFHVLIPMAEQKEAQVYCARVKESCKRYEDEVLSPSVACGIVMKTNVEQKLTELMGDAEYEMFEDKFMMKQEDGYEERLKRAERR